MIDYDDPEQRFKAIDDIRRTMIDPAEKERRGKIIDSIKLFDNFIKSSRFGEADVEVIIKSLEIWLTSFKKLLEKIRSTSK
jgi:hypothetical protein